MAAGRTPSRAGETPQSATIPGNGVVAKGLAGDTGVELARDGAAAAVAGWEPVAWTCPHPAASGTSPSTAHMASVVSEARIPVTTRQPSIQLRTPARPLLIRLVALTLA